MRLPHEDKARAEALVVGGPGVEPHLIPHSFYSPYGQLDMGHIIRSLVQDSGATEDMAPLGTPALVRTT